MSLSSVIQKATNSLQAQQIGLEVVGNNIANASTPGYLRQRVDFSPAPTQKRGALRFGLGVRVEGIKVVIDHFVQERARRADSDLAAAEPKENAYLQLEALIGELDNTDLSTILDNFFSGINDVLAEPDNLALRSVAVSQGQAVASELNRLDQGIRRLHGDVNGQIVTAADDINRLIADIAELNLQIVEIEGGGAIGSDAVGLRDRRQQALAELATLVDIRAVEGSTGAMSVFAGGDFLIFETETRRIEVDVKQLDGFDEVNLRIAQTDSPLIFNAGKLAGLTAARDEVLKGFSQQLDDFTNTFFFEFNQVYTGGQGTSGYSALTSEFSATGADAALDNAGLPFTPVNGSFQIKVLNRPAGVTKTSDIVVNLNGLDDDTSLNDLVAALDAVDGIAATIKPTGELTVQSDSPDLEFAFANDSSGVLAALGLGTFFSGSKAADAGVNAVVAAQPSTFAASQNGFGEDTNNAVVLAGFMDRRLESSNGNKLTELYDELVGGTIEASSLARSVAEGLRIVQDTVRGEQLAVSGVNIDEEAVRMIAHQRAFQASARLISVASDLLDMLVEL